MRIEILYKNELWFTYFDIQLPFINFYALKSRVIFCGETAYKIGIRFGSKVFEKRWDR